MNEFSIVAAFVAGLVAAPCVGPAVAADASGSGSTFVYPVMSKWVADYRAATGNRIADRLAPRHRRDQWRPG